MFSYEKRRKAANLQILRGKFVYLKGIIFLINQALIPEMSGIFKNPNHIFPQPKLNSHQIQS